MDRFSVKPMERVNCEHPGCQFSATHKVEHRSGSRVGFYCLDHARYKAGKMNDWDRLIATESREG